MEAEELWKLYAGMLTIRRVEEQIADRYVEQEMRCPVHLSIGQEATPVAVSACLQQSDKIVSAHRSHAHYLAKGGDLVAMLGELYGRDIGCARGKGGSMHLFDLDAGQVAAVPIVGSSIPIGVGVAWGEKLHNRDTVVAVYFGDGATEEGAFAEALDFASLHGLQVLFVCENNLYSVYTPLETRQSSGRDICKVAEAHGVAAFKGDGNDVEEVCCVTRQALDHMKCNDGPALIELSTYRWLEHCGPNWDDELGYRKPNELRDWMNTCPVAAVRQKLIDRHGVTDEQLTELDVNILSKIDDAFAVVKGAAMPSPSELFTDVYA